MILTAEYIVVCFVFSKCFTPPQTSEELEKTTPSSDEVFAPQHGGRGAKDNTTKEENFPGSSRSSRMKSFPVDKSKAVWMICNSLGIPENLDNGTDEKGFEIQSETKIYAHCEIRKCI
ncbi:hypothetical protein CDAR_492561 [Caerostris darwini]|uniref:Uncharacterized protein n=1 Tax=Caerostris darwini TaxID=1538125 RepID=A0AAV4UZ12_9ARAC|nr:hypothetical protein CDAR_492561 [Caerostris darwini]